jgi:hypothetical protein
LEESVSLPNFETSLKAITSLLTILQKELGKQATV